MLLGVCYQIADLRILGVPSLSDEKGSPGRESDDAGWASSATGGSTGVLSPVPCWYASTCFPIQKRKSRNPDQGLV